MDVSLFVTCLTDTFYPRTGIAVVKVLERLGCRIDFPQAQTCCGQPMWNNGFHDDARELAKRMISVFEHSRYVVSPSGSCVAMIHDYYGELFKGDHAWEHAAHEFAHKTYEFSQFLTKVLKVDVKKLGVKWPGRVTYHYSCHLRGIGVKSPQTFASTMDPNANAYSSVAVKAEEQGGGLAGDPIGDMLRQVEGLEYVPLEKADQCCGFGGTFAMKYPQMSGAMVLDKVQCIERSGAPVVVSNEGGCTMNIAGACNREKVNVRFISLAEILAEGLGLMERSES